MERPEERRKGANERTREGVVEGKVCKRGCARMKSGFPIHDDVVWLEHHLRQRSYAKRPRNDDAKDIRESWGAEKSRLDLRVDISPGVSDKRIDKQGQEGGFGAAACSKVLAERGCV